VDVRVEELGPGGNRRAELRVVLADQPACPLERVLHEG